MTQSNDPVHAPSTVFHPTMLLVRWEIAVRAQNWSGAASVAKALIAAMPSEPIGWIYQAFAQHKLEQIAQARQTLLTAARKFPNDWRIAHNLACYAAESGDRAGAQNWRDHAREIGSPVAIEACA